MTNHFFYYSDLFFFRYITEHNLQLETFTSIVFKELSQLEESKPGIVAKLLLPILQNSEPTPPPKPNTNVRILIKIMIIIGIIF